MTPQLWALWAFVLILQNFSFTFVSRARNSGSLKKHLVAGIFSNGIWFASQIFAFSAIFSILTGKYGIGKAMAAGAFYTAFTLTGSLLAHQFALKTEKGKTRVGAHKDVAEFNTFEGAVLKTIVADYQSKQKLQDWTLTSGELATLKDMVQAYQVLDRLEQNASAGENLPEATQVQTTRWVPSDVPTGPASVTVGNMLAAKPGQGAKL